MQEFEKEMIETWNKAYQFDEIVNYIKMLKHPTYEHLGKLAAALNNLRRYYEALEVLESIQEEGEKDFKWHYRYAYTLICLEEYEKAEDHLLTCITLNNEYGDAWFMLGELYRHFIMNEEKLKWVEESLKTKEVKAEELNHEDFVQGQTFNKKHQLLNKLILDNFHTKKELISYYQQFIIALEQVIQHYYQIPKLVIGLANAIHSYSTVDKELDEKLSQENFIQYLATEVGYILSWFGVNDVTMMDSINLFLYTVTNDKNQIVSPEHLYELVAYSHKGEHQNIVDFYKNLSPMEKSQYEYAQWAIQAHIHLEEYGDAIALLEYFSTDGEEDSQWYYWYALCCTNINEYEDARDLLYTCLTLDLTFFEAWDLLEFVLLNGFNNPESAFWVKTRKEHLIQAIEQYKDGDDISQLTNIEELRQHIFDNKFKRDNNDFFE